MNNKEKKIYRDSIYAGKVVKTSKIHRYPLDVEPPFGAKPGSFYVSVYYPCRTMMFIPNEKKLAQDLFYASPNYPILNISDREDLYFANLVVKDSINLGPLLKYFGYGEHVTSTELKEIRNKFFTGRFAKDNCELFGMKEILPEDKKYFKDGKEITDPRERVKAINFFKGLGPREFIGSGQGVLPFEYWNLLDKMGNNELTDVIIDKLEGSEAHIDSFKPSKKERHIKRLIKY